MYFSKRCLAAALLAISLAACSTTSQTSPIEIFERFISGEKQLSEFEQKELERSRAWKKLTARSEIQGVGNARLQVTAKGALGNGIQKVEDTFLTRAAAETLREGYDGFVIRYLTYESEFPVSITNGFGAYPETVRIDSYEEFLAYSKEQRIFISAGGMGFKRISGVIEMVKQEDHDQLNYFAARDLFENFIASYRYR